MVASSSPADQSPLGILISAAILVFGGGMALTVLGMTVSAMRHTPHRRISRRRYLLTGGYTAGEILFAAGGAAVAYRSTTNEPGGAAIVGTIAGMFAWILVCIVIAVAVHLARR